MKKHYSQFLLSLTAMLTISTVQAGDPKLKIDWSQEYLLPKKHADIGFIGNPKVGYTQMGYQLKKSLSLQHFSPDLNLESTNTIDLKGFPAGLINEGVIQFAGKTYWAYSTWEKSTTTERLFLQELDLESGSTTGEATQLTETGKLTGDMFATGFYKFELRKYEFFYSSDSTKLGVVVQYPNASRNDAINKEKYGFFVFDKNLNQLWKNDVEMPYTEKKMDIYDKTIDRSGNVYFVARVFDDESEKRVKDGKVNFHFEILKFAKGGKKATSIPFKFENNYVSQLGLFEDFQGNIVCSGFYSDKTRKGKISTDGGAADGTFFLRLDPGDNKLTNVHKGFYEFPAEVLMQFEKARTQKKIEKAENKGTASSANLRLRNIYFGQDGSLTLFGEEYYMVTRVVMSGKTTRTYYDHRFNDILVQRIGADGELVWTKKIPKSQFATTYSPSPASAVGLGMNILNTDNGYNIFFMDNLKNMNLPEDKAPATHATALKGILVSVNVDKTTGDTKKTKVFDTREMKDLINIINADKVGSNTFINRTWIKKKNKVCLLTVED